MSLAKCFKESGIPTEERLEIKSSIKDLTSFGMTEKKATLKVVKEKLKEANAERKNIIEFILKNQPEPKEIPSKPAEAIKPKTLPAIPKEKKITKEPARAEPVARKEAPVEKKEQYAAKVAFKDTDMSLEDLQKVFEHQKVKIAPDGSASVTTALGKGFVINFVETIEPDKAAFHVGYGRMKGSGEMIAGKYKDGIVTISKVGDIWTVAHEGHGHWAEEMGFINKNDQKALSGEINRRVKKGTWKTLNPDDIGGKEDRAEFIAQELKSRSESRPTVQRVLQKIQDLIDAFVNLYKRTARGVTRDIESGKIYEKEGEITQEKIPAFMVAGKKAIGAPTGALNKAQEMLAEGKSKDEVWKETGWLKGAEGEFKFEIDDSGAKIILGKSHDGKTYPVLSGKLKSLLNHKDLFKAYPELQDINIETIGESTGLYTGNTIGLNYELLEIGKENELERVLLHEIQHAIQEIEGFARGGAPGSVAESDIITTADERTKLKEYKDRMDALFFEGKDWDSPEVTVLRSKRDEYTKSVAEKKFGKDFGFKMYQRLAGEIEARDTAARAELTPAQRGIGFNKAVKLWDQTQNIRQSDKYQAEEQEWSASDMKDADLKKRNESPAHKKLFAIEDEVKGMGYNLGNKLVREALAGGEIAQELLVQPLYESQRIPEADWIIKKGSGTSFSVKEGRPPEQYSVKPPEEDAWVKDFLEKHGVDPQQRREARTALLVGAPIGKTKAGTFQETLDPVLEEDYISNRKISGNIKLKVATNIKRVASEVVEIADKYLGAISTRLGQVSPKLKAKLRKLDFDISTKSMDSVKAVEPLLRKAKKMTREDFADWDYARKNSDIKKINELINKYGMQKEYIAYRKVLDGLRKEGLDVGLEIGEIDEYAPRILKDSRGFLTDIGKAEEWPVYSRRLQERAQELGITVAEMTPDMKADMISNMILGGWVGLGGIPSTKQRKIQKIPAYLNKHYLDSDAALMQHIHSIRKAIEARKFFGKIPQKVAKIRTRLHNAQAKIRELRSNLSGNLTKSQHKTLRGLKKLAAAGKLKDKKLAAANRRIKTFENILTDTMPDEQIEEIRKRRNDYIGLEKQYAAYIGKYALQRDYTENIGSYIMELINNKEIAPKHEREVNDILKARFHEEGTRGVVQAYKNLSYIDTMGSPISALTQIGDLAWAAYEGGLIRALKYAYKSARGKARITRKDVGVERIAQEFADSGTLGNAVTKVFKMVGLEKIDAIGKEALLNTALDKYQKQAESEPLKLKKQIRPIFEGETDSVIDDLVNDEISENVKLLVYSRLLDFQPVGLSEMPQGYLTAGNWRLLYMLKTFTIKVFDVYRNEVYNKIKKGSKPEKIQGLKNLARLSFFFVLANAGADELKDWVLGRKTDLSDRLVDNMLRLFGVSKFVTWKARTEGVGSALARQILPPFKFVDSLGKDIITAGDEKGLEVVGSVPVVGKLAYWHVGRGVSKRGDLWDRRWRKRKAKLNKVQDKLEKSKDKRAFRREHRSEILELHQINRLQGRLNSYRKKINRLKSKEETIARKKLIQRLESKRTGLIKEFLGRKTETKSHIADFTKEYVDIRNAGKNLNELKKTVIEFNRKQTEAGRRTIPWSGIVKKGNRIRRAEAK